MSELFILTFLRDLESMGTFCVHGDVAEHELSLIPPLIYGGSRNTDRSLLAQP